MKLIRIWAASFVAALGCSGGGENPAEPNPPKKGEVSVQNLTPSVVNQTATEYDLVPLAVIPAGTHSLGKKVAFTCTMDGADVPCGVQRLVAPVKHTTCVVGRSDDAESAPACRETMVKLLEAVMQFLVVSETGGRSSASGITFFLGEGTGRESFTTGLDGKALVHSRYVGMSNVPIWVPGTGERQPWFGRTSPEFWARPNPVIGPRFVMTPSCATAEPAQRVEINLEDFYTPGEEVNGYVTSLFRTRGMDGLEDGPGPVYGVGSWRWPVRVAFNSPVSSPDSVWFWNSLRHWNNALCAEVAVPSSQPQVMVHLPYPTSTAGPSPDLVGDFLAGAVGLHASGGTPELVLHEWGHVLGLGHTKLQSVMRGDQWDLTSIDVAAVLLMQWIREGERENNSRFSLAQMHQGWRKEVGLSEEAVAYVSEDGQFGSVSNPSGPASIIR